MEWMKILIQQLLDDKQHVTMETEHSVLRKDSESKSFKLSSFSASKHDYIFVSFLWPLFADVMQNTTIEERVALLEILVLEIQEDIVVIEEDVTEVDERVEQLEGDVNFLFDEQVIQDERIFTLEQTSIETSEEIEGNYH